MKENLSKKSRHLIQVVGRRTGLSSDVIRAWERRYKAIVSQRTETNRRLYTDDDIEKMKRYFILCLIGFKTPVGGESESINYLSKLTNLIDDAELLWQRRGEDKTKLLLDKLELIRFNVEKYMMS